MGSGHTVLRKSFNLSRPDLKPFVQSLDPDPSSEGRKRSPRFGIDSAPCSLSSSHLLLAASQGFQQLETHMQRPESDITYFDDVVPSELLLRCRPVSSHNDPILFYFPCLLLSPPRKWTRSGLIISHFSVLLKQMHIFSGPRNQLYLQHPTFSIASHHFFLWQAAYSQFFSLPKEIDFLQWSGPENPPAHRAWAAASAEDSASGWQFFVLRESLKQKRDCIAESALTYGLLPTRTSSKKRAPLHGDKDWYTF